MKNHLLWAVACALLLVMPVTASAQSRAQRAIWNKPAAPFDIIGNVYYVGTAGLSSYLIAGPEGHVLIDGALPESAPIIATNIQKLGFRLKDVKYLLVNHSHVDHAGGLAALKRMTGAQLIASEPDKRDLEGGRTIGQTDIAGFPPVHVDRVIRDGETVTLGPIALTAMLTPGHTRGATTWAMPVGNRRVLFVSSISVAGQPLIGGDYPTAAADFRRTFKVLRATKADIFLAYHAEGFDLNKKRARLQAGDPDAFVDATELPRAVDRAEQAFDESLAEAQAKAGSRH